MSRHQVALGAVLDGAVLCRVRLPGQPEPTNFVIPFAVSVGGGPKWVVPSPALSVGLHIYASYYASLGAYEIVVRVSNGIVDEDGKGFVGATTLDHLSVQFNTDMLPGLNRVAVMPAPGFAAQEDPGAKLSTLVIVGTPTCLHPRQIVNRRAALCSDPKNGLAAIYKQVTRSSPDIVRLVPSMLPPPKTGLWKYSEADEISRLGFARSSGTATLGVAGLDYFTRSDGFSEYMGNVHPGAAGGEGIEFQPGWEGAVGLRLMMHDITMNRMAVAAYHRHTGEPIRGWSKRYEYHLSRGWQKLTKLPWSCAPSDSQWDDSRRPLVFNTPPPDNTPPPEPFDGQHLIRGYRHGLAVLSWVHDRAVLDDLNMILWDCRYSWTQDPAPPSPYWNPFSLKRVMQETASHPGFGHSMIGREFGWVLLLGAAMSHYLPGEHGEWTRDMARCASDAQMSNGFFQVLRFGAFYGAPDPWRDLGATRNLEVAQGIEHGIVTYALGCVQRVMPSRENRIALTKAVSEPIAIQERYDRAAGCKLTSPPLAKWSGVSRVERGGDSRPLAHAVQFGGVENFNIWAPLGMTLYYSERRVRERWIRGMLAYPVPDKTVTGTPKNAEELLAALRSCPHTTHTALSIAALEQA